MADMSTYLETKVADYTTTELTVSPHRVLVEEGDKAQVAHEYDDGDLDVVTMSASRFKVTLQWDYLSTSDADDMLEFWYNLTEGRKKTFYWLHPVDGNTYVARFLEAPVFNDTTDFLNGRSVNAITIQIEGVKA